MKSINMTQEQIQDIQEKYKMNFTVAELCDIYNVGRKTIYKYTKGLKRYYQDKKWLTEHYINQQMNKRQIAKILNVSEACIRENMKILNIETDDVISRKRLYSYKHDYFSVIDSEDKAYWIGFIHADGFIRNTKNKYNSSEKYLSFQLARKDKTHLQKFIDAIESNIPIKDGQTNLNGKIFLNSSIRVRSIHIVRDLIDLGFVPGDKMSNDVMPNIPKQYIKDFIRGLFDGDGCISPYYNTKNKQCCSWCIVGSKNVCEYISELFKNELGINMTLLPDSGIYRIETSTPSSIIKIMSWLYENPSCTKLDRKNLIFLQWFHI